MIAFGDPTSKLLTAEIDAVLGKPFVEMGHGPEAFYCLGLYLFLVERTTGIHVADPFLEETPEAVRSFYERFQELQAISDVRPLDALFWRWGKHEAHVATVENEKWCVSCDQVSGVHRTPLRVTRERADRIYRLEVLTP